MSCISRDQKNIFQVPSLHSLVITRRVDEKLSSVLSHGEETEIAVINAAMKFADVTLYYDGKQQPSTSGKCFISLDPSTALPLAKIHESSSTDVDAAIASAQRAFPAWSRRPAVERCNILLKAAALLRQRNDELATIETLDTGKPFSETSTVDVISGAEVLEYFARLVGSGGLNGETTQLRESTWIYTRKEALGVCAGIGAFNYPIQIAIVRETAVMFVTNPAADE